MVGVDVPIRENVISQVLRVPSHSNDPFVAKDKKNNGRWLVGMLVRENKMVFTHWVNLQVGIKSVEFFPTGQRWLNLVS